MEILGALPKMRMIAEPFNVRVDLVSQALSGLSWIDITDLDNLAVLERYLRRIEKGELRFLNPNPFVQKRFFTERSVFKVIHLPAHLSGRLASALDAHFCVLLRHPIPTSLSRKVFPLLDEFNGSVYSRSFTQDQLMEAEKIYAIGDHLEKGVLAWCLHFVPYLTESTKRQSREIIFYEDCVVSTDSVLTDLSSHLNETFPPTIIEKALRPSRVLTKSDLKTQEILKESTHSEQRIQHLVARWQKSVDLDQVKSCQRILDIFGVSVYSADDPMPKR